VLPAFALLAALAARAGGATPSPRGEPFTIVERQGEPDVRLSPALARVVKQRFPAYRLMRGSEEDPQLRTLCREAHREMRVASAAASDFDGDGRTDAVLRLRRPGTRDAGLVVVFHATRAGSYEAHVLDAWRRAGPQFCVTRVRRGAITFVRNPGSGSPQTGVLRLPHDGIELLVPEAASRLYYWDGKRYRYVETSD